MGANTGSEHGNGRPLGPRPGPFPVGAERETPVKVRRLGPHPPVCECRSVSQARRTQVSAGWIGDGRPGTPVLAALVKAVEAEACQVDVGGGVVHASGGGDRHGGHQPRCGGDQDRCHPQSYTPGHGDLLCSMRPPVRGHRWFGAATAADWCRIAGPSKGPPAGRSRSAEGRRRTDTASTALGVVCQQHGTTLRGFLPRAWDHPVASDGTTRRVVPGVLITGRYGCLQVDRLGGSEDGVPGGCGD